MVKDKYRILDIKYYGWSSSNRTKIQWVPPTGFETKIGPNLGNIYEILDWYGGLDARFFLHLNSLELI